MPSKRQKSLTQRHSVTSQKTYILSYTAVRTSHFVVCLLPAVWMGLFRIESVPGWREEKMLCYVRRAVKF